MDENFIAELKAKAAELTNYERDANFNPADDDNYGDACGYGDAYSCGYDDGAIHLARAVLAALGLR